MNVRYRVELSKLVAKCQSPHTRRNRGRRGGGGVTVAQPMSKPPVTSRPIFITSSLLTPAFMRSVTNS